MSHEMISCIVPVYNGERFLRETLDSILGQSYRPIELIVVDDGSEDSTPDIITGFGQGTEGASIRSVRQTNTGPVVARNRGLDVSHGEFIAFLDADDLWHTEKLARQSAFLANHPGTDAVFSHIQNFWVDDLREEAERFRGHRIAQPLPGYVPGTVLARAHAFDIVGPFNPDLKHGEMQEWVLRASERGLTLHMMPDVLTHRRLHRANRSRSLQTESREDFLNVLKTRLDRRRKS